MFDLWHRKKRRSSQLGCLLFLLEAPRLKLDFSGEPKGKPRLWGKDPSYFGGSQGERGRVRGGGLGGRGSGSCQGNPVKPLVHHSIGPWWMVARCMSHHRSETPASDASPLCMLATDTLLNGFISVVRKTFRNHPQ